MPKGILLVDDSLIIRTSVRTYLESQPGLEVCGEASNGVEALARASELSPDLIIMDLSMPRMDGLEAARQLKHQMPAVPIILFTQHQGVLRGCDADRAGISAVIAKSSGPELLIAQILRLLEPGTELRPCVP